MTTTYQYARLDSANSEIRLLTLLRGRQGDQVRIRLTNSFLGDGDCEAPVREHYEAVSYVWGPRALPATIIEASSPVGQNEIGIFKNLGVLLDELRLHNKDRVLWIDALCINQNDVGERSEQVALMSRVFSRASQVVLWLGHEEDDSTLAIRTLDALGRKLEVNWASGTYRHLYSQVHEMFGAVERDDLPHEWEELCAIDAVCRRPWFERLWTKQEVRLASAAVLKCGSAEMPWQNFRKAAFRLRLDSVYRELFGDRAHGMQRRLDLISYSCEHEHWAESYQQLRFTLRGLRWTDPRDAIFAMLSVLDREDRSLGVRADYTLTTAEVYQDVVLRMIHGDGELVFLHSCELETKSIDMLPSWVPDWSSRISINELPWSDWHASAWISPRAKYLAGGVLQLAGIRIATIDNVVPLHRPTDYDGTLDQLRQLRPPLVKLDGEYVGGGTFLKAYCSTLVCNTFSESIIPPKDYFPRSEDGKMVIKESWSRDDTFSQMFPSQNPRWRGAASYLIGCQHKFEGRSFFITEEGYIGLAPVGTRSGDQVCVVLGCNVPIVLRQLLTSSFQVVGPCYMHGVMNGEAITGRWPSHWRPVLRELARHRIGKTRLAVLDTHTEELLDDPAEVLKKLGFAGARYQRNPHILTVPDEVLEGAGVKLQDFRLV